MDRIKNAFIKQEKISQPAPNIDVVISEKAHAISSKLSPKFQIFSFVIFLAVLVFVLIFSFFKAPESSMSPDELKIRKAFSKISNNIKSSKHDSFYTNGIKNANQVSFEFETPFDLSKGTFRVYLNKSTDNLKVIFKDNSFKSNSFNPIIIKTDDKAKAVIDKTFIEKHKDEIIKDCNFYRIKEIRLILPEKHYVVSTEK